MALPAAAICFAVAGTLRAAIATETFTLAWTHSVQRSEWREDYRVADESLVLEEARVQGSGAGMEMPSQAVLDHGWWRWRPGTRLPELALTLSPYAADYRICIDRACRPLHEIVRRAPDSSVVTVAPCAASAASGPVTPPR